MSSWRSFRVSPLGGAFATLPATAAVENATTASPAATKPTYGATDGPDDSGGAARSAESSVASSLDEGALGRAATAGIAELAGVG